MLSLSGMFYFNSIKVQLKLPLPATAAKSLVFQFHKGTIKAMLNLKALTPFLKFQFHKGTIKALISMLRYLP